ncbi:MAG: peptidoglycan-binding domain-containing protein, partial [Minisyncoccia bacterium]
VLPTLSSITSTTTDGSYGIDGSINITATFSEPLGSGSTMTVLLNTGASVTLNTVSGSTLTGTYTVTSSNTAVQDLTVSAITSASVNDIPLNNTTSLTLPSSPNNIADTKAIIVNVGGAVSLMFLSLLNPNTPPVVTNTPVSQTPPTPPSQSTGTQSSPYLFTRNLSLNMQGQDVKELQKYLNLNGFTVALQGPGSPGNETTLFGSLTKAALIRFQEAYASQILTPSGLTRGTGFFGPSTRGWVNGVSGR